MQSQGYFFHRLSNSLAEESDSFGPFGQFNKRSYVKKDFCRLKFAIEFLLKDDHMDSQRTYTRGKM